MAADDSQLLARLLAGEQKAFKELVSTYQSAMRAVAYAIVGSRHADEIVQDAWLSVVRNLSKFEARSSLKTWLLTITANAAKGRYKQNRREVLLDDLPSPHGTIDDDRFSPGDGHWLVAPFAWHTRCSACRNCKAVCYYFASVRGWSWKKSVIFWKSRSPMFVCCCIGHG